jgi:hypothetical protein
MRACIAEEPVAGSVPHPSVQSRSSHVQSPADLKRLTKKETHRPMSSGFTLMPDPKRDPIEVYTGMRLRLRISSLVFLFSFSAELTQWIGLSRFLTCGLSRSASVDRQVVGPPSRGLTFGDPPWFVLNVLHRPYWKRDRERTKSCLVTR